MLLWQCTHLVHLHCATADACCSCQGYTGAFIVTSQGNRPSGQGYVTFNSKDSQNEAFKVRRELRVHVGAAKLLTAVKAVQAANHAGV